MDGDFSAGVPDAGALVGAFAAELSGMPRILVVTGTDTGVGKTFASAALCQALLDVGSDASRRVRYVKIVQTGTGPCVFTGEEAERADAEVITELVPGVLTSELVRLPEPLAPVMAADLQGVSLPSAAEVLEKIRSWYDAGEFLVIEGAGGLMVEVLPGVRPVDLVDRVREELGAEVSLVLVARPGLGTLNHTELSLRELFLRQPHRFEGASGAATEPDALPESVLPVAFAPPVAVVLGNWPAHPSVTHRLNREQLRSMAHRYGASWWGEVPEVSSQA